MLYSYKMTHDFGFAPNPFHGVLTLATCKPMIRKNTEAGMHVAGFTSKGLCGDEVGQEKLIYMMRVTKKINYDKYYHSEEFKCKIPSNKNKITQVGDNIYFLLNGKYEQAFTYRHTDPKQRKRDLRSDKVLISTEFFYFGVGAIPVDKFKINIPKTQAPYGIITHDKQEIERLWKYLESNFQKNIVLHLPHQWHDVKSDDCNSIQCGDIKSSVEKSLYLKEKC